MNKYTIFLFLFSTIFSYSQQVIEDDSLYRDAEFPGGKKALDKFLKDNLIIPDACLESKKYGIVYTRILIDKDGSIIHIHIDSNQTSCKEFDHEARRIIQLMPKWNPGIIDGKAVKISYLLPLEFFPSEADELFTEESQDRMLEPNWAGFELGICTLMNSEFQSSFPQNPVWENQVEKSWHFNYNFFEYKIPIFKHYFGITTGLGYSWRGISFRNNYQLTYNIDSVFAINGSDELTRNKLTCHYFSLPLLFEFSTNNNPMKNFYMSAGLIGSWKFSSYTFQKGIDSNGDNYSHFSFSKLHLSKWNLESTLRIGYGYLGVYAAYQMNSLFHKNKTIPVYPFRVGLTFNVDYYSE